MTGRCAGAIIVFATCVAFASAPGRQQFRAAVDVVTVNVSVRAGTRTVGGLTAGDFELRDNGVPQAIDAISTESLPIDVTLLLDASSSVDGPMLQRLKAGVRDTSRLLTRDDLIRTVLVQHRVSELFAFQPGGGQPQLDSLGAQGSTSLFDGLSAAMMRQPTPDRPYLIIALTDGHDTQSILTADIAKEIAKLTDAVLYVVVPVAAPRYVAEQGTQSLTFSEEPLFHQLVGLTGGQLFIVEMSESISGAFKRALESFRAGYVLHYTARGVTREGWHEIDVKVKKPGTFTVRAKKGYAG